MGSYLLGIDIGTSSVKASLVEVASGKTAASASAPAEEMKIISHQPGWAEQHPDTWWQHTVESIRLTINALAGERHEIVAIGIAYQMHGLVVVDKSHQPLRPSIIWCDSRAVSIGEGALQQLGNQYCLQNLLNSPGNFTASKLKWVKDNEPLIYENISKVMLPGDYIALRLTGEVSTTATGYSEGVFWDFKERAVSQKLLDLYGIKKEILAQPVPVFSVQGRLLKSVAIELGLSPGIPISYRAGDQPNNAFSLNVLNPGETAATAGTSGVIYGVTDTNAFDPTSRVNTFVHVNDSDEAIRNGVLLCINGTGILNSWLRRNVKGNGSVLDYSAINQIAAGAPIGAKGLIVLPFGNGTERILENKNLDAAFLGLNFNSHDQSHLFRAAQEGIVFAMKYGFDILQQMGLKSNVIRAGHANMFLSQVFREAFVNTTGARLELYNTDGSKGAALGAGVGAGVYKSFKEAFTGLTSVDQVEPDPIKSEQYQLAYTHWKNNLNKFL